MVVLWICLYKDEGIKNRSFQIICVHIEGWLFKTDLYKIFHISSKSRRMRRCSIHGWCDGVFFCFFLGFVFLDWLGKMFYTMSLAFTLIYLRQNLLTDYDWIFGKQSIYQYEIAPSQPLSCSLQANLGLQLVMELPEFLGMKNLVIMWGNAITVEGQDPRKAKQKSSQQSVKELTTDLRGGFFFIYYFWKHDWLKTNKRKK